MDIYVNLTLHYSGRLSETRGVEPRDISTLLLTLANLNYTPPEGEQFLKVLNCISFLMYFRQFLGSISFHIFRANPDSGIWIHPKKMDPDPAHQYFFKIY